MKKAAGFVIFRKVCEKVEYLLLKASYGSFHWTPPKGHVDPGEDDFTTALRETREEAGYKEDDLRIYKDVKKSLYYQVKGKPKETIYWLAELKNPQQEVTLSDEHTELKWLEKDGAKELVGHDDFSKLLDEFHEKIL
ncbi:NUDT2 family protein [Megaselia abdita]